MSTEQEKALIPLTPEQRKAYEELGPAGQVVYKKIRTKAFNLAKLDVLTRWEIGEIVRDATNNERKYGADIVGKLAKALGGENSEVELYQYRQLANVYSREQVERLISRPMVRGGQISWSHIRALVAVDGGDPASPAREELAELCFKEQLTTAALIDKIRARMDKPERRRGGLAPKTPSAAMQQADKYRQAVVAKLPVWEKAIFGSLVETPPDQVSDKLLQQISDFRKGQEELRAAADAMIKQADEAEVRLKRLLTQRSAQPTAAPKARANGVQAPVSPARPAVRNGAVSSTQANVARAMAHAKSLQSAGSSDYDDSDD